MVEQFLWIPLLLAAIGMAIDSVKIVDQTPKQDRLAVAAWCATAFIFTWTIAIVLVIYSIRHSDPISWLSQCGPQW